MEVLEPSSADGTRIGCELVGEGPPLLAVHGSTADRHRFAAVQTRLAESFRLHLMDRRGRGLSAEETPADYSLEREAEDIRAVVAAIDGPVLVLAHSYGGACALEAVTDCEGIARMLVYEPAERNDLEGSAVFISAGRMDPIVPVTSVEKLVALFEASRANVTLKWQLAGHSLVPSEVREAAEWLALQRTRV